jgi:Holliday junction resolvase RusA-like endonuclease
MRDLLVIEYPVIPPTSNKLYFRGTQLTAVARQYGESFSQFVAQRYGAQILELDNKAIYALHLRFFFESLTNPTFENQNVPPSKRAKTRYKRIDLSNRIKLLEDCIRDAIDIDDSQTFAASQEKHQIAPGEQERVMIMIQRIEPKFFGLSV